MSATVGPSTAKINDLMSQVQKLELDLSEAKRHEQARSREAWLKIKMRTRDADEKWLDYKRQWDLGKRDADAIYNKYKEEKLQRKRIDADLKLVKIKKNNAIKTQRNLQQQQELQKQQQQ
ncbi:hypothetical protein GNI_036170 [Gregarina niphandrodes]|uniref:Uncharacterized protein n=1 Tax=Gregarina niphandrodes TaxID=110365 RepID=A0A023BAP6_GRENI|nr:hypothetical protein GNI_036170 [Gregarina niphandrodes]EZG78451.1 hypothetical protein GNI_036170 [Gregarina niphandrodes]|eukprot:XP_011129299.1 hypothetical protein GNI_036170 [Gregarina niphandrodes]